MKRLAHWLVMLYPHPWRERYADEFHALLEQSHPGLTDMFDIVHGALSAHWQRRYLMQKAPVWQWSRRIVAVLFLLVAVSGVVLMGGVVPPQTSAEVSGQLLRHGEPGRGDFGIEIRRDDETLYAGYVNEGIMDHFDASSFATEVQEFDYVYITPFARPVLPLFGNGVPQPIAGVRTADTIYMEPVDVSAAYTSSLVASAIITLILLIVSVMLFLPDLRLRLAHRRLA